MKMRINKVKTVYEWCEVFGISMIDNDGFRQFNIKIHLVTLSEFLEGIVVCTIMPFNQERYSVLNELL